MRGKREISFKGSSFVFDKEAHEVEGLDKIQTAIDSLSSVNDTVSIELNVHELLFLRSVLVQNKVSSMLTYSDIETRQDLSQKESRKKETLITDHTKTVYENDTLTLKYVIRGNEFDRPNAVAYLIKVLFYSKVKAERYLNSIPHQS